MFTDNYYRIMNGSFKNPYDRRQSGGIYYYYYRGEITPEFGEVIDTTGGKHEGVVSSEDQGGDYAYRLLQSLSLNGNATAFTSSIMSTEGSVPIKCGYTTGEISKSDYTAPGQFTDYTSYITIGSSSNTRGIKVINVNNASSLPITVNYVGMYGVCKTSTSGSYYNVLLAEFKFDDIVVAPGETITITIRNGEVQT